MTSKLAGEKVVGIKQTTKALKSHKGKILYIAEDADETLIQPIIELSKNDALDIVYIQSMKELGNLCTIDVAAAVVLVLKD